MATEIGGMKDGSRLLAILLKASEKAANIARTCRRNEALFSMLVQEKSAEEKNPRFFQDFKTLADVLIQETIRHEIEVELPELSAAVQGEESNMFSNSLGETIIVKVCPTLEETSQLLAKVMGDDPRAAELLAIEVHKNIELADVPMAKEIPVDICVNINDLGIWVDPIDSTADYINGIDTTDTLTGLNVSGFRCITVLIGVYEKSTSLPIVGVVNQPFYTNVDMQWKGSCNWGFVINGNCACSINRDDSTNKIIALSRDENSQVKAALANGGFTLIEASGAGYKILTVALAQVDAYVLSKGSTYKWDTCGPQAILRSLGGGIVEFKRYVTDSNSTDLDLKYVSTATNFANSNGLIAYRNLQALTNLKQVLCDLHVLQ